MASIKVPFVSTVKKSMRSIRADERRRLNGGFQMDGHVLCTRLLSSSFDLSDSNLLLKNAAIFFLELSVLEMKESSFGSRGW